MIIRYAGGALLHSTKHLYQVSHHVQYLLSSQLTLSELANISFISIECAL